MALERTTQPDLDRIFSELILALTEHPEAVDIEFLPQPDGSTIQVCAPMTEFGKIIGSGGRLARSLRALLVAAGMAQGRRYALDVQKKS